MMSTGLEAIVFGDGSEIELEGDHFYTITAAVSRGSSQICDNFPARAKNFCDIKVGFRRNSRESDRLDEGSY